MSGIVPVVAYHRPDPTADYDKRAEYDTYADWIAQRRTSLKGLSPNAQMRSQVVLRAQQAFTATMAVAIVIVFWLISSWPIALAITLATAVVLGYVAFVQLSYRRLVRQGRILEVPLALLALFRQVTPHQAPPRAISYFALLKVLIDENRTLLKGPGSGWVMSEESTREVMRIIQRKAVERLRAAGIADAEKLHFPEEI